PAAAALQPLPREQQVDGVIRELLGGAVSPDTRQVLLTGTNPFLQANADKADSLIINDDDNSGMLTPPSAGNRPARRGMN
ncbi:hypothetical protein, partial [Proteus faecis]|uniref:hypothetical protein n=1 Tax=Proteus faecis TaxID=2050967 RepID=UPI003075D9C0